jgi:hypothetical protein
MRVDFVKQFAKDCHQLGIVIHGTSSSAFLATRSHRGNDPLRHRMFQSVEDFYQRSCF